VRYFFYIGGNDSAETAHILNEIARGRERYDVRLFHVPKTIDNDLRVTDHCPGYGSAARFRRERVHGRQPGQPQPAGHQDRRDHGPPRGLADGGCDARPREHADDGPHLIYVPERVFSSRALHAPTSSASTSSTAAA
jgi:6-phosphofructokinase 1